MLQYMMDSSSADKVITVPPENVCGCVTIKTLSKVGIEKNRYAYSRDIFWGLTAKCEVGTLLIPGDFVNVPELGQP